MSGPADPGGTAAGDGAATATEPAPLPGAPPGGGPAPPARQPRPARRRRRRIVLAVVGAVVLVVVALVGWYEVEANPFGGPGRRVVVVIRSGESAGAVADTLARRDVIGSTLAFRLSLLVHGTPTMEPGGYVFRTNESFSTVRSLLAGGPTVVVLDVLPGNTVAEVAAELSGAPGDLGAQFASEARAGAVASPYATPSSGNLEGLLGTGQYQVLPGESVHQLLSQMVARFDREAAAAGLTPQAAQALGLTPYQLVTVASIAEKEGYYQRYFGQVARVVYNRLAANMTLDMTSTVLYALGQDGGPVSAADQKIDSPYNTYLHTGLTPTPICFPSEAALAAAVSPTPGTWLYFTVVSKSGTTAFADTYTEQLANEKLAQSRGVG